MLATSMTASKPSRPSASIVPASGSHALHPARPVAHQSDDLVTVRSKITRRLSRSGRRRPQRGLAWVPPLADRAGAQGHRRSNLCRSCGRAPVPKRRNLARAVHAADRSLPRIVGREDREGATLERCDRAEGALVEGEQAARGVALGDHDEGRVGETEPQVAIARDDVAGRPKLGPVEALDRNVPSARSSRKASSTSGPRRSRRGMPVRNRQLGRDERLALASRGWREPPRDGVRRRPPARTAPRRRRSGPSGLAHRLAHRLAVELVGGPRRGLLPAPRPRRAPERPRLGLDLRDHLADSLADQLTAWGRPSRTARRRRPSASSWSGPRMSCAWRT